MDRTERAHALSCIRAEEAISLADRLTDGALGEVEVISPPTVGMLMARAIDGARGETFNVGEVLVSEARVSVAGVEGWGMVLGSRRDHALAMAVVDANLEAGHPRGAAIERVLARLVAAAEQRQAADQQRVAPTRVRFETF
jgi:alpha-D-ribose 1-methylphosphonate 5-triphosphate synthase subunit PhnG